MNNRKKNSLYGTNFKSALSIEQPWLQAEKLPNYLQFFVKKELLEKIASNSNHLICGRRGTGKTHLLGAFHDKVNNQPQSKSICVMISTLDFSQTPPLFSRGIFRIFKE